jgi:hypothetical protein
MQHLVLVSQKQDGGIIDAGSNIEAKLNFLISSVDHAIELLFQKQLHLP